mmetsp:Transcript_11377/g.22236  ORF Transcript_11377/g.22236 Transcript_11377/m.22236 type:complete len:1001 (-) Transcript_11377:456-3458(-)
MDWQALGPGAPSRLNRANQGDQQQQHYSTTRIEQQRDSQVESIQRNNSNMSPRRSEFELHSNQNSLDDNVGIISSTGTDSLQIHAPRAPSSTGVRVSLPGGPWQSQRGLAARQNDSSVSQPRASSTVGRTHANSTREEPPSQPRMREGFESVSYAQTTSAPYTSYSNSQQSYPSFMPASGNAPRAICHGNSGYSFNLSEEPSFSSTTSSAQSTSMNSTRLNSGGHVSYASGDLAEFDNVFDLDPSYSAGTSSNPGSNTMDPIGRHILNEDSQRFRSSNIQHVQLGSAVSAGNSLQNAPMLYSTSNPSLITSQNPLHDSQATTEEGALHRPNFSDYSAESSMNGRNNIDSRASQSNNSFGLNAYGSDLQNSGWDRIQTPYHPSGENSSLDVFMDFCKFYQHPDTKETRVDASGILSKGCFDRWLLTRQHPLKKPEESFRKTITAHCTGTDGRKPFTQEVEAAVLIELRRQVVWPCFVDRTTSRGDPINIGQQGFRGNGYHEDQALPVHLRKLKRSSQRSSSHPLRPPHSQSFKPEEHVQTASLSLGPSPPLSSSQSGSTGATRSGATSQSSESNSFIHQQQNKQSQTSQRAGNAINDGERANTEGASATRVSCGPSYLGFGPASINHSRLTMPPYSHISGSGTAPMYVAPAPAPAQLPSISTPPGVTPPRPLSSTSSSASSSSSSSNQVQPVPRPFATPLQQLYPGPVDSPSATSSEQSSSDASAIEPKRKRPQFETISSNITGATREELIKETVQANRSAWSRIPHLLFMAMERMGISLDEFWDDYDGDHEPTIDNVTCILTDDVHPQTLRASGLIVMTKFFRPHHFLSLMSITNLSHTEKIFDKRVIGLPVNIQDPRFEKSFLLPDAGLIPNLPTGCNVFCLNTFMYTSSDRTAQSILKGQISGGPPFHYLHPLQFWMVVAYVIPTLMRDGELIWQSFGRTFKGDPIITRSKYIIVGDTVQTQFQDVTHIYPRLMELPTFDEVVEKENLHRDRLSSDSE